MKRSECTVDNLKALNYKAMKRFNSWLNRQVEPCNEKQSEELFEAVVNVVKNGGFVDIQRNNFSHTVNVFLEEAKFEYRGTKTVYFLSRPMTEAEILEADLYTGRNKVIAETV